MHGITDPVGEIREEVIIHLRELEARLTAHGFAVEVEEKFWCLTATQATERWGPKRSQSVQVATDAAGALNWYLVSPAGAAEEVRYELLCPAAAIAEAAARVAHTLRQPGQ